MTDILSMDDNRWPKQCLREEVRNILNSNSSKWGKAVLQTLKLMKCEEILELIWRRQDPGIVKLKLNDGLELLRVQEEETTRALVYKSTYCSLYKLTKTKDGCEDYWMDTNCEGWIKEVWSRLRCGNVERGFKKGFKDWSCRICQSQQETRAHLLICRKERNLCSDKTAQAIQLLTEGKYEADLDFLVKELLRGPPIREVCCLIAAIEKAGRKTSITLCNNLQNK